MTSVLRVAYTLTWDPEEVAEGNVVSKNQTYYFHGSGVSIIPEIAESLNLTVKTYFGDIFQSFDLVANKTADMGRLLISQDSISEWDTNGMESLLGYLHPLDSETSDVYFKQPRADSAIHTITRPFSTKLWLVLLFLMLLVALISRQSSKTSFFVTSYRTIIYAIELLIGRHDVHFRVTKVPASIALTRLIVSFFGIIISSVYIGKIASIFVLKENLVKSPNDLLKYKYKLNTYSSIHVHRVFENSNKTHVAANQINLTIVLSYIKNVIGKPNDDPRETLFSHPDGFYSNALYSLHYDQELCAVSVFKSSRKTARSFYIRKDSPLREALNLSIVKLIERGINYRHQTKFKSKFKFHCLQQETEFNQLTFRYVELGFVPLFLGYFIAVIFDFIEKLAGYLNNLRTSISKTKFRVCPMIDICFNLFVLNQVRIF